MKMRAGRGKRRNWNFGEILWEKRSLLIPRTLRFHPVFIDFFLSGKESDFEFKPAVNS
jgi:hypothetical protein